MYISKNKYFLLTFIFLLIYYNCKNINETSKENILLNKKKTIDTIKKKIILRDSMLNKILEDSNNR